MLDIRVIRETPDEVKAALATVGVAAREIDEVLGLDESRRALIGEVERLRNERATASKRLGKMSAEEREPMLVEMRALGDRIGELEKELAGAEEAFEAAMLQLPNIPHPDVPVGPDESANIVRA